MFVKYFLKEIVFFLKVVDGVFGINKDNITFFKMFVKYFLKEIVLFLKLVG